MLGFSFDAALIMVIFCCEKINYHWQKSTSNDFLMKFLLMNLGLMMPH